MLREWLSGCDPWHPLLKHFQPADVPSTVPQEATERWAERNPVLTTVDEMLSLLDSAAPLRLGSKRTAFRKVNTVENYRGLRAELAIGAYVAESGLHFDLGGDSEPDFVMPHLGSDGVAIEVGSRRPGGLGDLAIEIGLRMSELGVDADLDVFFDGNPPAAIRPAERTAIVARAEAWAKTSQPTFVEEAVLPAHPTQTGTGPVKITVQLQRGAAGRVPGARYGGGGVAGGSPHVAAVILDCCSQVLRSGAKRRQATARPTLLAVDLTHSGVVTLAFEPVMSACLDAMWESDDTFAAVALFRCFDDERVPTILATSVNPFATEQRRVDVVTGLGLPGLFPSLHAAEARRATDRGTAP